MWIKVGLALRISKTGTCRHCKWYHFHENAWSEDYKIKNGSSWRGWRRQCRGYEAIPSKGYTAWTLLPLPEQGIASPLALHQPWVRAIGVPLGQ